MARKFQSHSKRVLVTGGPTRAYLDRVRYLSNISTGKTSLEICKALRKRGFRVALVMGPTYQACEKLGLDRVLLVETTEEMRKGVLSLCQKFRPKTVIFSSAVLDFEPEKFYPEKFSSQSGWIVKLRPTPKIIDEVARRFPSIQRIGFKLEWGRPGVKKLIQFGIDYRARKGLMGLCVNYLEEISEKKHPAYWFSEKEVAYKLHSKAHIARHLAEFLSRG